MNVSFRLLDESKKESFDEAWKNAGLNGLNGHRTLGGYRASLYNALPIESVQVLVDIMKNQKIKYSIKKLLNALLVVLAYREAIFATP